MAIYEEYGVFRVFDTKRKNVANITYYGLYALRHQGQESCGIVVNNGGVFSSYKGLRLVSEVFSKDILSSLSKGSMAVGYVRRGTTGGTTRSNAQPIEISHQRGEMAIVHNGGLSNSLELRGKLELSGTIFNTTSNTETIVHVITRGRLRASSMEETVSKAMSPLEDAYSLVLVPSTRLIATRDPHGFRPLCYRRMMNGKCVVASESCALSAVGATFIGDVLPGEIVVFSKENVVSREEHCSKEKRKTCIFEYIYFTRPDSVIDTISVSLSRCEAGELLVESYPVDADVVIGVPDSGMEAALGYANASKIPYGVGLIRNRYIGRTLISSGQDERLDQVGIKLSPARNVIEGKRVVLINDSVVRDTASECIVKLLKDADAKEIHMKISTPPFLHPCYYGIDIDSEENLITCHHSIREIEKILDIDSPEYLPIEKLGRLVEGTGYCTTCFSGEYPTNIPKDLRKDRLEGKLSERICSG